MLNRKLGNSGIEASVVGLVPEEVAAIARGLEQLGMPQ